MGSFSKLCAACFFVVFLQGLSFLRPPPHVATLGERGRADNLRSHPGVGPGGAHLGGVVPLPGQSKVGYLQSLVAEVLHLHPFEDQDWVRQWWKWGCWVG